MSDIERDEGERCPKCGKPSVSPPAEVYCVECATEGWQEDAIAHLRHQLAGAVDALREWLAADDAAEVDFTDETEARLDAAIVRARSIAGGQYVRDQGGSCCGGSSGGCGEDGCSRTAKRGEYPAADGGACPVRPLDPVSGTAVYKGEVEVVDAEQLRGAVRENVRWECAVEQIRARLEEGNVTGARATAFSALGRPDPAEGQ